VADAQAVGQHVAREGSAVRRRQARVERQFGQHLDAQFFQPVRARLGVHQAEGRGVGGEELARMRLERHDAQRRIGAPGQADHMGWPRCTPSKLPIAAEAPRSSGRVNW
jgi:hypothetical protein